MRISGRRLLTEFAKYEHLIFVAFLFKVETHVFWVRLNLVFRLYEVGVVRGFVNAGVLEDSYNLWENRDVSFGDVEFGRRRRRIGVCGCHSGGLEFGMLCRGDRKQDFSEIFLFKEELRSRDTSREQARPTIRRQYKAVQVVNNVVFTQK